MAFSTIDADTSWQDLTIAQQLAVAYNKRAAACPAAPQNLTIEQRLSVSAIDSSVSVYDFVAAMQDGIEDMATLWGDPSAALSGETSVPSNFAYIADMMTAAGLTESGYWRRIAEGGSQPETWTDYDAEGWSYGRITSKDLAGPWLFIDLQTALTAMTRRVLPIFARTSAHAAEQTATSYPDAYSAGDPFPVPPGTATMALVDVEDKPSADLRVDKSAATGYAVTTCMTSQQTYSAYFYGSYAQFLYARLVFVPSGTSTFYGVTGWPQNTLDKTRYIPASVNVSGVLYASAWTGSGAHPAFSAIAAELPDSDMDITYPYSPNYRFMTITQPVIVLDYAFSPA